MKVLSFISKKKASAVFSKLLLYFLLIGIGMVFLHPILYMLDNSFKSVNDLVNPTIEWIPSKLYLDNYS